MPSTNKLASHKSSRQPRHHVRGSVAKFLLSFCGLASFGVVTKLVALGTVFLVFFAIPVSITLLSTNNTYATGSGNSNSNTITANLPGSVAIRLLDSTGTTEISSLDFNNLTPTPQGTTASKSFIVDVATSNPTGYKLYMQSDYKIDDGDNDSSNDIYTTNLTHTDSDVTDSIPTLVPGSGSSADTKVYWNYVNPLTNSGSSNPTPSVIPPYGTPDKIAQYFSPTNSHQSTIDINVGIDTTIVSGTYENQLLFSAVGNPTNLDYSITFNMDGGEPQIAKIEDTAAAGSYTTTLPSTVPTKTDYLFSHWQIVSTTGATASCSSNSSNNSNNNNGNNNDNSTQETSSTAICNPGDTITIHSGIDQEGDFVGDITLLAIYDNAYTYTITYDCNGGTGCPNNSSYGPTTDTSYSYTIPEATIEKTGYDFTGLLGSDSNTYNIGDTITIESAAPDFTLTAQYKPSAFDGITTMQEMTATLCANASEGDEAILQDIRDNNSYKVRKLKDGNCWMTQNLDLRGPKTLTSADSNIASNWTLPILSTDYVNADQGANEPYNAWCNTTAEWCQNRPVSLPADNAAYGTYYTWNAATAGTGTFSSGDTSYSICPKGWRLPMFSPNDEFQTLANYYPIVGPDNQMLTGDPAFVLPGRYVATSVVEESNYGRYWTNTNFTGNYSYHMVINNSSTNTAAIFKYSGLSIRCLANESIHQLTVDPAGGTWSGSTDVQKFTGESGSSKTIANPTPPANIGSYNISYNDNSQGATYNPNPPAPTSVNRQFSGWSLTGVGSFAGGTFQYGNGDATLTANYDAATFTLPTITKEGLSCKWAEGSTTGTKYTGGSSVMVTGDTEFYAVCEQPSLAETCADASIGSTFTYPSAGGIQYIKLKTNSAGTTSACYTKSSQGTATWANASSKCPSGTFLPSKTDFDNLITAYGEGSGLNNATGWGPGSSWISYWSSTVYDNGRAYRLLVSSSGANVIRFQETSSFNVVCIVR